MYCLMIIICLTKINYTKTREKALLFNEIIFKLVTIIHALCHLLSLETLFSLPKAI